ncbi:MAG TPA: hypothetical protein VIF09_11465 [Polyangiaceae bacterium]|jgi:hypothetical protein
MAETAPRADASAEDAQAHPTVPAPAAGQDSGVRVRVEPAGPDPEGIETRLLVALQAGDAGSALLLASAMAYMDHPSNEVARRIKLRCVSRMRGKQTHVSPPLQAVPRRLVEWNALLGREFSRQATYVLSLVDGASTVEAIIDASAIPPLEAYEALDALLSEDIIGLC